MHPRVCAYSHDLGRIIKGVGIPGPTFWIRAYIDLWWNKAWSRNAKREWRRIVTRKSNATVVDRMRRTYYGNMDLYLTLDDLSPDQELGAILAESATWRHSWPTDVDSDDMSAYVDEHCGPLLYTTGPGW
jgi:hypothetical protein